MSRVFFWSGGNDGCAYYRCTVPAGELARRGHDVHVAPAWIDSYFGRGDGWLQPDVLVGQRICKEGPSEVWLEACNDPRVHCVYELDDDLFTIDPSSTIAFEYFSQADVRYRIEQNIRAADSVTVSTEPLAEVLRPLNPRVTVVPNTIPRENFRELPERGPFALGWHGSATHEMDWAFAADQVKRWLVRNPTEMLKMIGADYGRRWGLPNVHFRDWVQPVSAMLDAFDFLVGLAPLRPHAFNRSKSHLKALEYAARGIPTIASAEEPYLGFIDHGVSGALIRRDHEWSKWLNALVHEPSRAREMGRAAFKRASAYTTESWGAEWCRALGISEEIGTLGV